MKQKKKIFFWGGLGITGILCFVLCASAYADAPDDIIISVQRNYPELFKQNSIILDAARFILWKLVLVLQMITRLCVSLYDHSLGFMTSIATDINEYVPYAHELFTVVLALSLLVMGIIFIIYPKKKPDLLVSLFLMVVALSLQTVILNPLLGPTKSAVEEIAMTRDITSKVVSSHIYDLIYIDNRLQNGLADLASGTISVEDLTLNLTKEQLDLISINDTINYENQRLSEGARGKNGILGKKAKFYYQGDGSEDVVLMDIYNGFGWNSEEQEDFMNQFYYRYKVDTLEIVLVLFALIIVYVFMSYKVIRIVIEILMGNILAIFYSANFNNVQKTVQILKEILNAFLVLLLSAVLIRVFYLAEDTLNRMNVNGVVYGFLLVFLAFAIIDGPNIIQRIVGVDAGLSNELGKLFAISQMAQLGGAAAHAAGASLGAVGGMAMKGAKKISSGMGREVSPEIPPEEGAGEKGSESASDQGNGNRENTKNGNDSIDFQKLDQEANGREVMDSDFKTWEENQESDSTGAKEDSCMMEDGELGTNLHSEDENVQINSSESKKHAMAGKKEGTKIELGEEKHQKPWNQGTGRAETDGNEKKRPDPFNQTSLIGKEAPMVDLSSNQVKSNVDLAKEMNQSYENMQKIGEQDVTGLSGITGASSTTLEVDWEFLEKGDQ